MTAPSRRRGRPATVTADQLALTALRLWDTHGYDKISLGEIAQAAGVNPRTLLRYFSSKSDIVWQALDLSFDALHHHLAATPPGRSLISRIRLGVLASLRFLDDPDTGRLRLRVISRTPELHTNTSKPFIAWRGVIRQFAADELGRDSDDLGPEIVAAAVQAATMTALIWSATHSDHDPADAVDRALRGLEAGFADRPAGRPAPGPPDGSIYR